METTTVEYFEGGLRMEAYVAWKACTPGTKLPAVVVCHTAQGPQEDFIREKCHILAEMGFVGFAMDAFGVGHCVSGDEKLAVNKVIDDDRNLGQRRVLAALEAVKSLPVVDTSRIAAIGYCLGGMLVMDLARAGKPELKGVVSFHGMLDSTKLEIEGPMTAKVLCYHGGRDPFVPDEKIVELKQELESKDAEYEIVIFGKCYHAFTRPFRTKPEDLAYGSFYNKAAAERSWTGACDFLKMVLVDDHE